MQGMTSQNSQRVLRNPAYVLVKNDSDADVPCFGVLEITNPLFEFEGTAEEKKAAAKRSAMNAGVELKGGKPSGDDGKITVITQESVPAGKLGRAVLTGTTAVVLDVKDTGHKYAVPVKDDVTKLETSDSGAWRVVNPLTETGEQIAYVAPAGGGGGGNTVSLDKMISSVTYDQVGVTGSGKVVCSPLLFPGRAIPNGAFVLTTALVSNDTSGKTLANNIILQSDKLSEFGAVTPPVLTRDGDVVHITMTGTLPSNLNLTYRYFLNVPPSSLSIGTFPNDITPGRAGTLFVFFEGVTHEGIAYSSSPVNILIFTGGSNLCRVSPGIPDTITEPKQVSLLLPSNIPAGQNVYYDIQYIIRPQGSTAVPNTAYTGTPITIGSVVGTYELVCRLILKDYINRLTMVAPNQYTNPETVKTFERV
ncbi:MAG: hypothetical protein LBQ54_00955 [Planctomycetaceae bacterium]|nr:hypothetical protein [Planctomycetaceae bacterium]